MAAQNVKSASSLLQRAQRGIVGIVLMGMVVVLLNRKYVPYWLRPEYYELETAQREAFVKWADPRISLEGRPMLFIGDSMAMGCPWTDTDVLALPGANPEQVMEFAAEHLGTYSYSHILVWVGTARTQQLIRELPSMIKQLSPHGTQIIVLAPMPHDKAPNWFPEESQWITLPEPDQQRLIEKLRGDLSSAEVFDPSPLLDDATNVTDGLHLSDSGFAKLRVLMAELLPG